MDKKKSSFDTSSFNSEIVKDIPQQMNGSDCGMFTCKVYIMFDKFNSLFILHEKHSIFRKYALILFQFAEYLSRDAPISFSQEDMPYYRRRMIYEIVKNNLMYP